MRVGFVVAIALLLAIAVDAKKVINDITCVDYGNLFQKSAKKSNDWDELESLLENIDEIGSSQKKKPVAADTVDDDEDPLERDRIPTSGAFTDTDRKRLCAATSPLSLLVAYFSGS